MKRDYDELLSEYGVAAYNEYISNNKPATTDHEELNADHKKLKKMTEKLQKEAKVQAVPEGLKIVPVEPTADQFCGMARDIIQWLRFTESKDQHSESLVKWLKDMGNETPNWLYSEPEVNNLSKHVISKGSIAAIIYKAMLEAAPEQNK